MPCSICGLEGHNAKSCFRRVVAGLTAAGGETQVSAAADSAGSTVGNVLVASDGTPAAKKQRIDSVASFVSVPKDDDVHADVVKVMAAICEAVAAGLPALLKEFEIVPSELSLHEYPPLDIKSVVNKGDLSSYKEPWRKSRAVMSIASVSMYEAGGSPFWFRHSTTDLGDEFPRANVSWPLLCEYRDNLFAIPPKSDRILFPQTLLGYLEDPRACDVDFFPGNVVLVCGALVLWAMYLKFWEAMRTRDERLLRILWECALTCTIRVRTGKSKTDSILDTIRISETVELRRKGCTDTFIFCLRKAQTFAGH